MRALSIRQPFAELILRGIKTIEYRSRPTRILGERFWIYASKQGKGPSTRVARSGQGIPSTRVARSGQGIPSTRVARSGQGAASDQAMLRRSDDGGIWSVNLGGAGQLPDWMQELARQVRMIGADEQLISGMIVGSAVIEKVEELPIVHCPWPVDRRHHQKPETGTGQSFYAWHLTDVRRIERPRKPARHPQPVWFRPF